ncbi:hypothetical protein [Carboxylicivirga marina]|uniref:3-oxoacyl-ACP synthase n=1 Tax=Carboxylicivirga marina TaxID=2800988 RepID=A0ABS1HMG4_9BACT|nr:hypothetical protein [Carboxylicivirga marina]MBK3518443.1 hypothetical protein [Carboxylicivirga marina]
MNDLNIKIRLITELVQLIGSKIKRIKAAISDTSESMKNDTKSSAGDKFETGREMMQIELNKQQVQLGKQLHLQKDLKQINLNKTYSTVEFGSLVQTNKGIYLMAIAHGKLNVEGIDYYALSMASPIGQALKGAKAGDTIHFNKQNIVIKEVL